MSTRARGAARGRTARGRPDLLLYRHLANRISEDLVDPCNRGPRRLDICARRRRRPRAGAHDRARWSRPAQPTSADKVPSRRSSCGSLVDGARRRARRPERRPRRGRRRRTTAVRGAPAGRRAAERPRGADVRGGARKVGAIATPSPGGSLSPVVRLITIKGLARRRSGTFLITSPRARRRSPALEAPFMQDKRSSRCCGAPGSRSPGGAAPATRDPGQRAF